MAHNDDEERRSRMVCVLTTQRRGSGCRIVLQVGLANPRALLGSETLKSEVTTIRGFHDGGGIPHT